MGPYKSLFVIVDSNVSLWVLMGPYGSLCVLMDHYVSFRSFSVLMGLY